MTMAHQGKRGGRAALFIVSALLTAMFAGSTLLTPLYEGYRGAFGFSQLTLTLVYAVYALGNVAALLFVGRISDQIGRRRTALPAIAAAAVSSACYLVALPGGEAWLFVGRVVSGFAIGVASAAATAWIAELTDGDKMRSSVIPVVANYLGIALGPLLAGVLAQYTPAALTLTHWVYLGILVVTALVVATVPETLSGPVRSLREVSLRPRIGVPREIRARFVSPAATVFASFALVGFYAALIPTVLKRDLHQPDPLVSGAIVGSMFLAGAAGAWLTRGLQSRRASLTGLTALFASLVLLVVAERTGAMPVLLAGAVIGGVAAAMGYRGGLQVVNEIAPADRRAEVIASYLVMGFLGNSLPVVGVGVLSRFAPPRLADLCFTVAIAALTVVALVTGVKLTPQEAVRRAA